LLAKPKGNLVPIPLSYLRQPPPKEYLLGPRDVLGIYVEGVLGQPDQNPPVTVSEPTSLANLAPAIGFPVPVRDDGTIPLPLVDPIPVQGLTVAQAERAIIDAFTVKKKVLVAGRQRIILTLIRPRTTRVLVVRQDNPGAATGTTGVAANYAHAAIGGLSAPVSNSVTRRGTGMAIDLPAYENDVLTALTMTGGLPGFDAKNEVLIQRNVLPSSEGPAGGSDNSSGSAAADQSQAVGSAVTMRIPLRLPKGQKPDFRPEDILLHEGDVVCIEARDAEVFYTGGYLPPGEHTLPRDYDLDVVKAISAIGGPLVNGAVNANNFTGSLIPDGLGFYSPKLVSVLRKTPRGGQVTIIVDLDRAMQDPCQSLLIKPGDVVILQSTAGQAFGDYLTHVFSFGLNGTPIQRGSLIGTTNMTLP